VKSRRAIWISIIIVIATIVPLFAEGEVLVSTDQVLAYEIVDYAFKVDGKTTKYALRNAIIPAGGDPLFKSMDAMVKALDEKRQTLINRRVFLSVEYTYELEAFIKGVAKYRVTFYIEDASTFLALPYPKFDNDRTGLLLGVKAKDTNFFGTFGELIFTGYVAQNDGGLTGWDKRKDFIELSLSNLMIRNVSFDLRFAYEHEKNSGNLGSVDFSVGVAGMKLMGIGLGLSVWGEWTPTSDFKQWNPEEMGISLTYGPFLQNGATYTLNTTVELIDAMERLHTNTVMSQQGLSFFSHPISFNIAAETYNHVDETTMERVNLSSLLGTTFRLPFRFSWNTSVTGLIEYARSLDSVRTSLKYSNTLSYSAINYYDDLRKGVSFSLNHTYQYYPEYTSDTHWYTEGTITLFPFISGPFNPNMRIGAFYAQGKDQPFLPSSNKNVMDDYLRGYLSTSPQGTYAEKNLPWGGLLNFNFTMKFIDLGFVRTYINPFVDIGLFANPDEESGMTLLASGGIEGWGVLRRFPSYPIRGSLGFNLIDVKDFFAGTKRANEIEWELFIGFDLFF
jgi:hypothetical protein